MPSRPTPMTSPILIEKSSRVSSDTTLRMPTKSQTKIAAPDWWAAMKGPYSWVDEKGRKVVIPCPHIRMTQAAGTAPFTTKTGPASVGRRKKKASTQSAMRLSGSVATSMSRRARLRWHLKLSTGFTRRTALATSRKVR